MAKKKVKKEKNNNVLTIGIIIAALIIAPNLGKTTIIDTDYIIKSWI